MADYDFLPVPLEEGSFDVVKANSPFTRVLDFSTAYFLTGVAKIGDDTVATLQDRKTKKTIQVSGEELNKLGMKIVGVKGDQRLEGTAVTIEVAGEAFAFHYEEASLQPKTNLVAVHKRDSKGNWEVPKALKANYLSMNSEQKKVYSKWRSDYLKRNPGMEKSYKRFAPTERAIVAIKAGKAPRE